MADAYGPDDCQGSYRSSPDPQAAMIEGVTFKKKAVLYASVDNVAIVEGDIAIGRTLNDGRFITYRGVGISAAEARWPSKTIPYLLAPGFVGPERIAEAIKHWHEKTKIRFIERTTEADYVEFINGGGCYSAVGRQGGRQEISLGTGCTTGNAIHEMGHTVGLWHEQSREDRSQFIELHMENCLAGYEHNFDQHITDGDDLGAYDYGSIMHYPANAFSKNGQSTIIPKLAGVSIGQRLGLSAGDIAAVELMYP